MNEEPKDIKSIFLEALEKRTAEERAEYLDRVCGNDATLRAEFESLLKAHGGAGDFLESPAIEPGATLENAPLIEGPGMKIGHYELLELIGEGGMGLVYLAQQKEPVKRRVALKIIKPGMDSKEVIARFEAERQALALLDHHNIAHVFDAGTTETGRPYFVMEHVKGMSITRYCDEHRLDIEQRLRLFREVCEGVHHAHQKGIIHRDIKPSNILISVQGDRAIPKIIDFGIAKAATSTLTEKTMFTFQGQLLGTPEYMSPEQVDLATQDIDTRSDIYSLGVVLYELLAGVLPFEKESLHKIGLAELQHTLREVEPAPPSIRLSNLGQEAKAIADKRMTQVVPLARRLHRELEWIPLKAMRKDRCRRYKSASDMADDIQSYLNGNPLLAGPETAMYRVQKFVHKHAGSVATAALVSAAVIIGLVASIVMGCRAEKARQQEVIARKQVEQALARAEEAERIAQEQRKLAEEQAETLRQTLYVSLFSMAKEAYAQRNIRRVRELLDLCPESLRGWEWHRLNHISDHSIRTFGSGDEDWLWEVAVSPDGGLIASGGSHAVRVWDRISGSEVITLKHDKGVTAMEFSPDGKRIVSGDGDAMVRVWDVASGAEVMTLRGHKWRVASVAFSPDGSRIASGGDEKTVKVWDANSGAEVMTLRGHKATIPALAFSLDGSRLASGSWDGTIKVWDANSGDEEMTISDIGPASDTGPHLAFSPDGSRIVSGSYKGTMKVWDANSGAEVMTLQGSHEDWITSITFSPDSTRIVSTSRDIKIWDANSGGEVMTLTGHSGGVADVAFSPDGERIYSAGGDGLIKEWNPAIARDELRLRASNRRIYQATFSPDGKSIAASTGNALIKLWDVASSAEIMTLRGHRDRIQSIAFNRDGSRLVSGSYDKTVKVWNVATGTLEKTLTGHTAPILSVAFSPDGKRVASSSDDETTNIWNTTTGAIENTLSTHEHHVHSVTFNPDGNRIILGVSDGSLRIWDASSGKQLLILHGHEGPVWDISISPDGKRIASCSRDGTIRIWDAVSGEEVMTVAGHVDSVAFNPDGRRIVSRGGGVKIWDADKGIELMTLYGYGRPSIRSAVFSPDGKSICVGTRDYVALWESVEPAAGYEPRRAANSARELVEELYEKYEFYDDVISKLREDLRIVEPVRKVALQIANTCLWKDAEKLNSQSAPVVFSPDHNEMTYREALKKLEKAVSLKPRDFYINVHLGIARYRLGAYEDALATLARAKKIRDEWTPGPGLVLEGFKAMALQQLGRNKEADAVLQQVRDGFGRWFSAEDDPRFTFRLTRVIEVEELFAAQDKTLLSILKLIEENELDEASELIEKARQSENVDYVDRMEGAIKLLEVLHKRK